ncbi:unnamed protein product [Amoebophrya sp. A120]|nr:unnamed protein product [Amoebophrya sp. A120]|eukprot:GSA120T00010377001.1
MPGQSAKGELSHESLEKLAKDFETALAHHGAAAEVNRAAAEVKENETRRFTDEELLELWKYLKEKYQGEDPELKEKVEHAQGVSGPLILENVGEYLQDILPEGRSVPDHKISELTTVATQYFTNTDSKALTQPMLDGAIAAFFGNKDEFSYAANGAQNTNAKMKDKVSTESADTTKFPCKPVGEAIYDALTGMWNALKSADQTAAVKNVMSLIKENSTLKLTRKDLSDSLDAARDKWVTKQKARKEKGGNGTITKKFAVRLVAILKGLRPDASDAAVYALAGVAAMHIDHSVASLELLDDIQRKGYFPKAAEFKYEQKDTTAVKKGEAEESSSFVATSTDDHTFLESSTSSNIATVHPDKANNHVTAAVDGLSSAIELVQNVHDQERLKSKGENQDRSGGSTFPKSALASSSSPSSLQQEEPSTSPSVSSIRKNPDGKDGSRTSVSTFAKEKAGKMKTSSVHIDDEEEATRAKTSGTKVEDEVKKNPGEDGEHTSGSSSSRRGASAVSLSASVNKPKPTASSSATTSNMSGQGSTTTAVTDNGSSSQLLYSSTSPGSATAESLHATPASSNTFSLTNAAAGLLEDMPHGVPEPAAAHRIPHGSQHHSDTFAACLTDAYDFLAAVGEYAWKQLQNFYTSFLVMLRFDHHPSDFSLMALFLFVAVTASLLVSYFLYGWWQRRRKELERLKGEDVADIESNMLGSDRDHNANDPGDEVDGDPNQLDEQVLQLDEEGQEQLQLQIVNMLAELERRRAVEAAAGNGVATWLTGLCASASHCTTRKFGRFMNTMPRPCVNSSATPFAIFLGCGIGKMLQAPKTCAGPSVCKRSKPKLGRSASPGSLMRRATLRAKGL